MILEDAPRILLKQVRALPQWSALRAAGGGELTVMIGGQEIELAFELVDEVADYRVRTWIKCECGARLRTAYCDLQSRRLLCARCLGLTYYRHTLPGSSSRDFARKVLHARRKVGPQRAVQDHIEGQR